MGDARNLEAGDTQRPFAVGDAVPEFSLPDSDGSPVQLSQLLSSRRIVLLFYRGHW
ncbi:MAG: redoxin domain-containing protein [Chloroflexi bacterium]|nr:redoxin domain-containing protein [Chloroflexota bacterium]